MFLDPVVQQRKIKITLCLDQMSLRATLVIRYQWFVFRVVLMSWLQDQN